MLALSALGCGDDEPGGTLVTCEWLETEENCWRAAIREADACFGPRDLGMRGVFDARREVCAYEDGREVRFTEPVPAELPDEYDWNYDVASATGETCLEFRSDERTASVQSASGRVVQSVNGDLALIMTCPDGARFRMEFEEAFSCLFDLPGAAWSSSGDFIDVSALGGGDDIGDFVSCSAPM